MIQRYGVYGSGAHEYYAARIESKIPMLNDYDILIPPHVLEEHPTLVTYASSVFGFMAFILAMARVPVYCNEAEGTRFNGLVHIRSCLSKNIPNVGSLIRVSDCLFPSKDLPPKPEGNLLLFGNLGTTTSVETRDAIIDSFNHFDCVVLCDSLFCGKNESEDERNVLRELISSKYPSTRTPLISFFSKY